MNVHEFFEAIYKDDHARVKSLLLVNRGLAEVKVTEARLYDGDIVHWIYAGDTPLHLAAAGYRVEIARLLLAAGADPNARMNHRRSGPLHYAADSFLGLKTGSAARQVKTIECLLKAGADINVQDKNGATPLHRAVRTRGAAAARCLLKAGADPLVKNLPGSTAFHLAVQNTGHGGTGLERAKTAQREIIEMFLSAGVSARLKDGKGKTVVECASGWVKESLLT